MVNHVFETGRARPGGTWRKWFSFILILMVSACTGSTQGPNQNQINTPDEAIAQAETINEKTADSSSSHSAGRTPAVELFVFKKNGKYGYLNLKGEWVINPKYDYAYPFAEGLALVSLGGNRLLIDEKEKPVPLPEGVTDISMFKGGLAPVTINGRTGFINRKGKLVTAPFLDYPARDMAPPSEGMHMVVADSLFTFIDSTGRIIRLPGFEYALDFFEGRALVSNQGKYGYLDKSGQIVIPLRYDAGWSFSEGLALVGIVQGKAFQLSFIDRAGNTAINVPYSIVNPRFTNGLTFFAIEDNGRRKFGFIDRTGKIAIEPVYDHAEEIVSSGSKNFANVVAFKVKAGDLWGMVSGSMVVKPAFTDIAPFNEGLAAASVGAGGKRKFGFIDKSGNWVIQPQYDDASDFSNGLAAVRKDEAGNERWGYVDASGKEAIALQFRFAYNFLGDIALVQKDSKKAIIDRKGNVLVEE